MADAHVVRRCSFDSLQLMQKRFRIGISQGRKLLDAPFHHSTECFWQVFTNRLKSLGGSLRDRQSRRYGVFSSADDGMLAGSILEYCNPGRIDVGSNIQRVLVIWRE